MKSPGARVGSLSSARGLLWLPPLAYLCLKMDVWVCGGAALPRFTAREQRKLREGITFSEITCSSMSFDKRTTCVTHTLIKRV